MSSNHYGLPQYDHYVEHHQQEPMTSENSSSDMYSSSVYNWQPSPQATVESNSILQQDNLECNRARLSRRLSNRPSIDDLRDKGLVFGLECESPVEAEQQRRSIRAATTEQLQWKIQHRPDRQTLVDHHILTEANPVVSPVLHEAQEQLKKRLLKDELNSKLAIRPGALEVAEKGYLPLSHGAHCLLKDGCIHFPKVADASEIVMEPQQQQQAPQQVKTGSASRKHGGNNQKIEKFGSLTFHRYIPPSSGSGGRGTTQRQKQQPQQQQQQQLTANQCRESQQSIYLDMSADDKQSRLMNQMLSEVASPEQQQQQKQQQLQDQHQQGVQFQQQLQTSPMHQLQQQPAPSNRSGLEQLSAVQLRSECQKRGLKRSGTKEQLACQLEPYKQELAAEYGILLSPSSSEQQQRGLSGSDSASSLHQLQQSQPKQSISSSGSGGALSMAAAMPQMPVQQQQLQHPQVYPFMPLFIESQQQQHQHQQQRPTFVITHEDMQPPTPVSVHDWLAAAPDAPCATCPPAAMRSDSRDLELINQLIETEDSHSRMSITGPGDLPPPLSPMQLVEDVYSVSASLAGPSAATGATIPNQQQQQPQQQMLIRQLVVSSPSFFGSGLVTAGGTTGSGRYSSVTSELLTPRTQEFVFNNLAKGDMEIDLDNVFAADTM